MFNRAIVLSCALLAVSAGALSGCASPDDAQSVGGAAQQVASTAENTASNVAAAYHRGFRGHERAEVRREFRRERGHERGREVRRIEEHRAERGHWGWLERARRWWR